MTRVSQIRKGNTIFNSNQSKSLNSKFLKLCGAKKLTFPEVYQVFRMAQSAHLSPPSVAPPLMAPLTSGQPVAALTGFLQPRR